MLTCDNCGAGFDIPVHDVQGDSAQKVAVCCGWILKIKGDAVDFCPFCIQRIPIITLEHLVWNRIGDFDALVKEVTDILYTGFEAGGAVGNLPQLMQFIDSLPEESGMGEWLVIPDKETLESSMRGILDAMF